MKITYRLVPSAKLDYVELAIALRDYERMWPSIAPEFYVVVVEVGLKFKAKEMLGYPQKPYTANSNINVLSPQLLWIVDYTAPHNYWAIVNRVEPEQLIQP